MTNLMPLFTLYKPHDLFVLLLVIDCSYLSLFISPLDAPPLMTLLLWINDIGSPGYRPFLTYTSLTSVQLSTLSRRRAMDALPCVSDESMSN